MSTPAAPLKKALIEAGIGKDVFGRFNRKILQPVFTVGVRGANENQKDDFVKVVYKTLRQLCMKGIDRKFLEASVNIHEFQLRADDFGNKGLGYNFDCMDSWLYDQNPLIHLEYEAPLAKVKQGLTSNYFENMIEQRLLDNAHQAIVVLKPEQGLAEAKNSQLKQQLAEYKSKLSAAEIQAIVNQTAKLKKRQTTPDSAEQLETIPLLKLSDISPKVEKLPLEERQEAGLKVLFHSLFTNRIAYVNLYFDTAVVPQELLPYLVLLERVLGEVDTEKYSYSELSNEINIHTGGIHSSSVVYSEKNDDTLFYPKFIVRSRVLVAKLPELMSLLGEILGHSKFNDKKRLKELVSELKSKSAASILRGGQAISLTRVLSYISPVAKFKELSYLSFYYFVTKLEENFEQEFENIQFNLRRLPTYYLPSKVCY